MHPVARSSAPSLVSGGHDVLWVPLRGGRAPNPCLRSGDKEIPREGSGVVVSHVGVERGAVAELQMNQGRGGRGHFPLTKN